MRRIYDASRNVGFVTSPGASPPWAFSVLGARPGNDVSLCGSHDGPDASAS
jgi:hypothetical protein